MTTTKFLTVAALNSRVSNLETRKKEWPSNLHHMLASATYHAVLHGNITAINRLLAVISATDRRYSIEALTSIDVWAKGKGSTNDGLRKYVVLSDSIKPNKENTAKAEKLADSLPVWFELKAQAQAKRQAEKAALQAQAQASEASEASEEKPADNPETVPGIVHVRTSIATLAAKIRQVVADKSIADTDADIAAAFLKWYESLNNQPAVKTRSKKPAAIAA